MRAPSACNSSGFLTSQIGMPPDMPPLLATAGQAPVEIDLGRVMHFNVSCKRWATMGPKRKREAILQLARNSPKLNRHRYFDTAKVRLST